MSLSQSHIPLPVTACASVLCRPTCVLSLRALCNDLPTASARSRTQARNAAPAVRASAPRRFASHRSRPASALQMRMHGEIKHKNPQSWYNLYRKCDFWYLISSVCVCKLAARTAPDGADEGVWRDKEEEEEDGSADDSDGCADGWCKEAGDAEGCREEAVSYTHLRAHETEADL
eukprot:1191046-Rhodomonas_salina.1